MTVWDELEQRGFIADASAMDDLKERSKTPLTCYAGFDLTAPSFHAGHLVLFMLLRHLQRAGHKVIALLGGGTTQVGDPSDKNSERPLMELQRIEENGKKLRHTFEHLLCDGDLKVVNNADWLCSIGYLDFLKRIGRHFSVNRMLRFDFIKNRLAANQPLSFLEMGYMLLQSYDFVELHDRHNCCVQVGGQDQWANIISGVDLIRRMRGEQAFAVTCPLIATSSGQKMGKSAGGAIWLEGERLPPYDFWQFWRNTADADVERFLKLFTFLPLDKIAALTNVQGSALNDAKKVLADEVTCLIHGAEGVKSAHAMTDASFGNEASEADVKTVALAQATLVDLVTASGLVGSRSEARRHIRDGAVKVNGVVLTDETTEEVDALLQAGAIKVSVGRKKHAFLKRGP